MFQWFKNLFKAEAPVERKPARKYRTDIKLFRGRKTMLHRILSSQPDGLSVQQLCLVMSMDTNAAVRVIRSLVRDGAIAKTDRSERPNGKGRPSAIYISTMAQENRE